MVSVTNKLKIALDRPMSRYCAAVKQGNANSRRICITLTQDGEVYPLDGVRLAAIRGTKPDGRTFYNDCFIKDNEIIYEITSQTVAVTGTVNCEVVLFGSNYEIAGSAKFTLEVYERLFDDSFAESRNEYKVLTECISICTDETAKCTAIEDRIKKMLSGVVISGNMVIKGTLGILESDNVKFLNFIPLDAESVYDPESDMRLMAYVGNDLDMDSDMELMYNGVLCLGNIAAMSLSGGTVVELVNYEGNFYFLGGSSAGLAEIEAAVDDILGERQI